MRQSENKERTYLRMKIRGIQGHFSRTSLDMQVNPLAFPLPVPSPGKWRGMGWSQARVNGEGWGVHLLQR